MASEGQTPTKKYESFRGHSSYHHNGAIITRSFFSKFLTTDALYLAREGKAWGVFFGFKSDLATVAFITGLYVIS